MNTTAASMNDFEQEINGLPCGTHGWVQISVLPFDSDVGLIDAIALIGAFQVSATAPVQFRNIDLDPAPDATGVNEQTTFERHLGHVRNEIGNLRYHRTHQRMISPG
jgi:hypothetical protein